VFLPIPQPPGLKDPYCIKTFEVAEKSGILPCRYLEWEQGDGGGELGGRLEECERERERWTVVTNISIHLSGTFHLRCRQLRER